MFFTYLAVASLIAFFTVKIVGIPIGPKMFSKIVLSITLFIPLYLLIAYLISRFVSRDLLRLERQLSDLPERTQFGDSRIREISRLSKALSRQARRISQLIEAQRLMLYRLAHDLRTPVSNIRNVISGIKDGVIKGREREIYLSKALEETLKIERLLESSLSKLRKIGRESRPEEVDLKEFFNSLGSIWKVKTKREGIILTLEVADRPKLRIPRDDLEEIVGNLIDNALKHSGCSEVWVRAFEDGNRVYLIVEDDGRGIKEEKLVDSYKRGSLGFYLVRELTWKWGGEVSFEKPQKGTRVVISFPKG